MRHADGDQGLQRGEDGKDLAELVAIHALADGGAGGGEGVAAHDVDDRGEVEEPGVEGEAANDVAGKQEDQQHRYDNAVRDLCRATSS